MEAITAFIKRLFQLIYLQLRRVTPRPIRHFLVISTRALVPSFIYRHFSTFHREAKDLAAEKGFRGIFSRFKSYTNEFSSLLNWLIADPERPGLKTAFWPTVFRFAATFFQALTFAIIAGYFTLASTDWILTWRDYSIKVEPVPINILVLAVLVLCTYAISALLNYLGGNMMLKIGLRYQDILSRRILEHYRQLTLGFISDDYMDAGTLHMIINSECRYLGRALLMLYTMAYQVIAAVLGFIALVSLDPILAVICIVFIVVALIMQIGVMGKTLNDTRNMMVSSGDSSFDLRQSIATIALSPTMFDTNKQEIDASLATPAIQRYNSAYYDRLRVALFSSLVPQLLFAVFVSGLFAYSIYALNHKSINSANAIQYVFSLRFFFGGLVGILGGFVSIISFKPFFDNYLEVVSHNKLRSKRLLQKSEGAATAIFDQLHFDIDEKNSIILKPGEMVSVVVNKGAITWLDIAKILEITLRESDFSQLTLKNHVSIVHTEFPLVNNQPYSSLGLIDQNHTLEAIQKFPYLKETIEDLVFILNDVATLKQSAIRNWRRLKNHHMAAASILAATYSNKSIVVFSEAALRSISERDRKKLIDRFHDKFLILHYGMLPNLVLKPAPIQYILLDKTGVIVTHTPETILNVPPEEAKIFNKTSLSPNTNLIFFDEEL